MKPILILQHLVDDGPAYLGEWLARERVPADLRCTEAGDAFPADLGAVAGLAVLGGAMSANDDLPSLHQARRLIRAAMAQDIPVIGHCLGGQLMAQALGARVIRSPAPEIGWMPIRRHCTAAAAHWFGADPLPQVFQWHYEAFTLPEGAEALATSAACPVQAFSFGRHLAMQFHVEQDAAKLLRWTQVHEAAYPHALKRYPETVQAGSTMLERAEHALAAQQRLADRLYRRWLHGLG